ncbi:MAG: SusC/RagA family TonB-linked outer membrane protein [Bacteroidota bacterium]|nr:SusC/RagA family TonB-linked outer membrane protein [Bacteroidota bacterium]
MKIIISFIAAFLLLLNTSVAQKTISGNVYNEQTKLPLEGVTVKIKNGTSVHTDSAGYFIVRYNGNAPTLLLSSVGYFPLEITGGGKQNVFFLLPYVIAMDEVTVSTGYQQLPKERSTGSFEKIDNKLLNRAVGSNVLDRLENVTSSLYFSKVLGTPELFIRGLSTIQGNTAPLIVLNNFAYDGDINNINPNDVESITVLKDAGAASIWGARAGNGVIVITTKKGKYTQPSRLSFSSTLTVEQRPDIYKSRNFINSPDYISLEKYLFSQGQYDGDLADMYSYPVVSPVVEILSRERNGIISSTEADAQISALSKNDVRRDYEKYLYRKAVTQNYSLGLSGGSEKINYLINAGFDKNQLALTGNDTRRSSFYSAINIKPVRRLEVNSSITYTDARSSNNGMGSVLPGGGKGSIYPYARLADDSGNHLAIAKDYRYGYIDTTGQGLLEDWHYRPLDQIKNETHTTQNQEILFNLGISYQFDKQLSFEVKGQYQRSNNESRDFYNSNSYFARNLLNEYTNIIVGSPAYNIPQGGVLDKTNSSVDAYSLRTQVNYNAVFGDNQLNMIAGAETRENKISAQGNRVYGYNDNILTFTNVDYVSLFQLYDNLGYGYIPDNSSFSSMDNRYISLYANGAYSYKNKYTISSSVRKDASNLFGVSTNQKWNPFWSTGVSWKISDESFYHLSWLPFLKARITYGYSGNINNGLSALAIITYSSLPSSVTNLPFAFATQPSNPDLRWERTGTINYGIDFATQKNKLSGSIEYYIKKSSDLLTLVPIDPTLGTQGNYLVKNAANLTANGIDIKLNSELEYRGIKWEGQLLFSYVRNRVTRYQLEYDNKSAYVTSGEIITPLADKDPYSIISYRWGGLDPANGDPIGYIDGKTSKDYASIVQPKTFNDLVVKGTTRPPWFGSFRNSFYYKGFGLSANIVFKWGYYFRRSAIDYSALFNNWSMNSEYTQRWQKREMKKIPMFLLLLILQMPTGIYFMAIQMQQLRKETTSGYKISA